MSRVLIGLGFCLLATSPAAADAADCARVTASFEKVLAAPGYRQILGITPPPNAPQGQARTVEMLVLSNVAYMRYGEHWRKIDMPDDMRKGMFRRFSGEANLYDCRKTGTEAGTGQNLSIFEYKRPPFQGLEKEPSTQTIALGDRDGLVYRLTSDKTVVTLRYDDLTPPQIP